MSAGYAARLKAYPHKGVCGLPEQKETSRSLANKMDRLEALVRQSSGRIVVVTGAGISTSAGIPDFRGPNGIWTLEQGNDNCQKKSGAGSSSNSNGKTTTTKKRKRMVIGDDKEQKEAAVVAVAKESSAVANEDDDGANTTTNNNILGDFARAKPTYTHRAVTRLAHEDVVRFVVTQNVDGLHRRSGLSRSKHAVLHGCAFTEKCEDCGAEHFRDFDCGGMSFQETGRRCDRCDGKLRDTLLDWEDPLPEDDLERATIECEKADLVLCLGTSLRIEPAGSLPTKAKKYVIVNLQRTPKDDDATLIIRSRVDEVVKSLVDRLGYGDWDDEAASDPPIERVWRPEDDNSDPSADTS